MDARARLNAFEQSRQRRRCVSDAKRIASASFEQAMREAHIFSPSIWADILAQRVEA